MENKLNNHQRYDYEIGNKVVLTFNPCNKTCQCFWNKEKADFLEENKEYEIEDLQHFGGGCPSLLLVLKDIKETQPNPEGTAFQKYLSGVPANWFKPKNN